MADSMIFPIGFDLEAAVKKASSDWDGKYADQLEKAIQKRSLEVKLKLNTKGFDSLEAVKKRLAELKIEPITPETKTAIKELASELRTLAKALEQVQKYSTRAGGTPEAVRNSKIALNEQKAKAQAALEAQRAARAEYNLAAARDKAAQAATRGATATNNANKEFQAQDGYVSRLIKRLAVYAGYRQIAKFLTSVKEVTAQFELQKVSLGAIIQSQEKANLLFSEIKSFALTSPVSILDLTKYTKQLAAYKIGYEELFETTKKLTDVSVGLGVSMDRVVLAYGQTRATGYLRASEIRQFTEMGVPIVEELASKLSKMNGELVTAAQVMDLVSKRGISFELVKEVFDDMTNKGGMFYNMQIKQGNTLYGMWQKLGDAASVMYDQIGNTDIINQSMQGGIQILTDLMRNWRSWGTILMWAGGLYLANVAAMKLLRMATIKYTAAGKANTQQMIANEIAAKRVIVATKSAGTWTQWSAKLSLAHAAAQKKAALATNVFSKALYGLKAAFLSNPIGMVIAAVTTLIALFYDADDSAEQFAARLGEINEKAMINKARDSRNFTKLAEEAVNSQDGSKEQKEKLDELNRTYGDVLGVENLRIGALRAMNHEYDRAILLIDEYNTKMKFSEREGAIKEYYGEQKKSTFADLADEMATIGFGERELGKEMAQQILLDIQSQLLDKLESGKAVDVSDFRDEFVKQAAEVFSARGIDNADEWSGQIYARMTGEVEDYILALNSERVALQKNSEERDKAIAEVNQYANVVKSTAETLKQEQSTMGAPSVDEYAESIQRRVLAIKQAVAEISGIGIVSTNAAEVSAEIDKLIEKASDPQVRANLGELRDMLANAVPTDAITTTWREKFTKSFDEFAKRVPKLNNSAKRLNQYMINNGETLSQYGKRIRDVVNELNTQISDLSKTMAAAISLGDAANAQKLKGQIEDLTALVQFLQQFAAPATTTSGRKSDPRLQNLKEEISLVQKLYNEYKQLEKQEGASKAASDMERMAKASLDMLSKKYGISLPTTAKDLTSALEILYKKMAALPKKVFPALDKELNELRWTIEKVNIDESQKQIEKQLKDLADRISRTKTAKEFYEKILNQTGDVELAKSVSLSIYGDTGEELFNQTVEQIKEVFKSGNADVVIEVDAAIDTANQRINYKMLADIYDKYQNDIIEKNRDTAQKIISEGQKTAASNVSTWEKELAKAKDYEQQRTDVIQRETQRRAEIYKSNLPQQEKDRLVEQSSNKQDKEIADLNWKEFKESDDYIKIFENLDNVSTAALKRLRANLEEVKTANADLSPENMKALVKAMEDIDEQISGRGFGNDMVQSVRDYIDAMRELKTARAELQSAQAEYDAQEPMLDAEINAAKDEEIAAQTALNLLKQNELATDSQITSAQLRLLEATKQVKLAENKKTQAAEKVKKAEQEVTDQQDKQKKATSKFFKDMQQVAQTADQLASLLGDIQESLGISADSAAGVAFDSAIEGLNEFSKILNVIIGLQTLYNIVTSSNPWLAIAAAVLAVGQMLGSFIVNNKVRKANKEIERQQELLDQLEYTYGRLEKAAEKAFGGDYINNFRQQQKNLQAQARAYQAQAAAERSKGKKADEDKIKEYENAYRDTMDEIADMQGQIAAQMLGTDLTSAARDFAQAWLDAYKEFGSTSDAMSEKFREMVENMVVEGALSRVMEKALQPMFDMIDNMGEQDFYSESFWKQVVDKAEQGAKDADYGAQTMMKFLEKAGISMQELGGDLTGISREVAGATSEEVNANTAALNTQNYYVSHVPGIAANVAAMRQLMEGGTIPTGSGSYVDTTALWNQHLELQRGIYEHTRRSAETCEAMAVQCAKIAEDVHKVIVPRGSKGSHQVYVAM